MKALGGKFAEATWNKAADVWKKILPEVEKKPEVAKAIQEVAEKSDDSRAEAMLSWQLEKLDPPYEMLDQIKAILDQKVTGIQIISADRGSVAVGGSIQGSTITADYHSNKNPE